MTHTTHVELRFNDFDMLGHLNNAAFFEITDLAKARFMQTIIPHIDWRHLDLAIVNIDCNFHAQIFPNDNIEVQTTVTRIGNRSFTMCQSVRNRDNRDRHYATVCSVFSAFDPVTLTSTPLPDHLRQALQPYLRQS